MKPNAIPSSLGLQQQRHQREEFRTALRALLMAPLMSPAHEDFAAVRRQAEVLRDWFARETGWVLQVEREGARLFKRPAELGDATRGLPGYDRRRYVLLCLACAVLERADAQITLRLLGERLLQLAADPALGSRGFSFALTAMHERRELVAVCRTLLALGVLQRVAGDEEAFVQAGGEQADALYDVQRRALAGMLAAVRGPSTWAAADAPVTLDQRLHALVDEHLADSDEARRTRHRHRLARRLLDDPVVYAATLDEPTLAYYSNQRGAMAARLCEATGLVAEQRAEGVALVDEMGELSDVAMPAEGTEAHATLLVAEFLAEGYRRRQKRAALPRGAPAASASASAAATASIAAMATETATETATATHAPAADAVREQDIVAMLRKAKESHGQFWRKSAREPGAERELAQIALERLQKLQLVQRHEGWARALPALARFALGAARLRESGKARASAAAVSAAAVSGTLFDTP
jgi:uncharacterized protein (TIGR02678 family)